MKYNQELPSDVEASLDAYIERITKIQWFKPAADIKRERVDTAVKASLSAFGIEASIEYRHLKMSQDWRAAWGVAWVAAWGAAGDAARDAAWGAAGDAAQDAARSAAWGAAWGAARGAARRAAWDAARSAAWGAAWDAAWGAARRAAWDAARSAAWGAAWGAADVLATHTKTYKGKTPFLKLVDIWEMGLYPVGVIDGKFIVYVPPCTLEFPNDL